MKLNIVPQPQQIKQNGEETVFVFDRQVELVFDEGSRKARAALLSFSKRAFEIEPVGTGRGKIELRLSSEIGRREGYRLTAENDCVLIEGADEEGVFWGVQTLCALLLQNDRSLSAVEIFDYPETQKRAFMLDCASWFFTVEAVKLFIDAMAMHKLNVFHWLLSGDAGWRLELYDNFLLSQIGSYRAYTGIGKVPHGGFYSREDTLEIIEYAAQRCITVVPQLNFPDRTLAAVSAYPFFSCFEKQVSVATDFRPKKTAVCLGKESSYDFVFSVLDETSTVFPSAVIHIGGEKGARTDRSSCPHCAERMSRQSLQDENELYEYFLSRVEKHLEERKVSCVACECGLRLPKGVIRDCRSEERARNCFERGEAYIDSLCDLSQPYSSFGTAKCYESEIVGAPVAVEARLHTEKVTTMKKAGELLFPRLGAFCENVWTKKDERSLSRFLEKIEDYFFLVDVLGFDHAKKSTALGKIRGVLFK